MKQLIYQVYVGKPSRLYDHCTASVAMYCQEHGIDHVVQTKPILRIKPNVFTTNRNPRAWEQYGGFLPIFEKENAFDYFDRYDQICIVDADIWIRPGSPNIFDELNENTDFAGVIENHIPTSDTHLKKIVEYSKLQYQTLNLDKDPKYGYRFFNMGLMLMNQSMAKYLNGQSAKEFIQRSEFERFINGDGYWKWSTDQTLLNWWIHNEKMNTKEISWKWNALFSVVNNPKEANFVHFFKRQSLPQQGENIEQLMKIV